MGLKERYGEHIKLQTITLSTKEKEIIRDYAIALGYTVDLDPAWGHAKIMNPKTNRFGFIQRRNGKIVYVFKDKTEDLWENICLWATISSMGIKSSWKEIGEIIYGIIDLEIPNKISLSKPHDRSLHGGVGILQTEKG